jgi:hypothetical protein
VVASGNRDGAIGDMREQYHAVAAEIAASLDVLAKAAARAPAKTRAASLKAIKQIAAVQEKLSQETQRLPASYGERFTVMHSVLQAQQGALVQLALIVKQLRSPAGGRARGDGGLPALQQRYQQPTELPRAVLVSRSDGRRYPSRGRERGGGRGRSTGLRRSRVPVFLKAVASRSLILVIVVGSGLLVAYSRFPRASDQAVPVSRRIEIPERTRASSADLAEQRAARPGRVVLPPNPSPGQITREAMLERSNAGAPYPALPPVTGTVPEAARDDPAPEMQGGASEKLIGPGVATAGQEQVLRPVAAPAAMPSAAASQGFVPVLFTHKDRATVNRALVDLRHRFPNVLMHRQSEVQDLDMGEKGIWHRLVVLPPGPQEQADAVCQKLMAGGYDRCWVKDY